MTSAWPHYGYAGKVLRVNLTAGNVSEDVHDEETLRKHLGGTGLGVKYLYDEVPPGVEWSDPANRIFLGTGPLGGTTVPGSGTFSVVTKGPLTNGATTTQANGFFGAFLRFAGYDGVLVHGASEKWVYLYVHDGIAEIRDAHHLLDKDTWETQDAIVEELGLKPAQLSVACIGPAGENLARLAAVCADHGHAAGHNGPGAVMGSKRLKAIAVSRGRGRVALHDSKKLNGLQRELFDTVSKVRGGGAAYNWGTLSGYQGGEPRGTLPVKNYTTNIYPDREKLSNYDAQYIRTEFQADPNPCWACRMHHCHHLTVPKGQYKGWIIEEPEYEGLAAWGATIGPTEVEEAAVLSDQVDRLGMDTNEAGYLIGWVVECYEKGILTKEDTDGLEMTWGNAESARQMLHKVARRQGLGKILAEGTKRASEIVGRGSQDLAVFTQKGNSPRGHDHRSVWHEMFDTSISSTGTIEAHRMFDPKQIGLLDMTDPFDPVQLSNTIAKTKGAMQFEDSLGVCRFITDARMPWLIALLNAATGWDFTIEEAMDVGRRAVNTLRAFNLRHGIGPEMDGLPSTRYCSVPVDGPNAGKDIKPHWDWMLHNYYEQMGWDKETGTPLPYTLKQLGLQKVAADLWAK